MNTKLISELQKHRIGIFSYGRVKSQRCPNKMLRPLNHSSLADILLSKLAQFGDRAFFAGHEAEFKAKCEKHKVAFVQRTEHSASIDGPIIEVLGFLKDLPFDYYLIINGCLPFLKTQTIESFLEKVLAEKLHPMSAVTPRMNYFFEQNGKPINFSPELKTLNTKSVDPILEFANALYFFKKSHFFEHGRYWDWNTLKLFTIDEKIELLDVDTEEDFAIVESLHSKRPTC